LPPFEPPVELQAEPPVKLQVEHSSESVINEPLHVEEQDRTGAFYGFGENDFHPNHHEYEAEGGEFFDDENHKNAPTSANRRYPLRNRKPKVIQFMNLMDSNGQPFEPGSFLEAMDCREAHLWRPSVQDEFDSHIQNETWVLVPLPPGRTAIGTRWVFKVKPGYLDTPARYKSRFVAKGYSQVKGIDFNEYAIY
ncbi:putative Importin subunit alpha-2/sw, partial [Daphnia magna]